MQRFILPVLVMAVTAAWTPAQVGVAPGTFSEIWVKHRKGEDVSAALTKLQQDASRPRKERFNAAYLHALIHLGAGKPEKALERLAFADQMQSGRPQVAVRRAEAKLQQGDVRGARKDLEKVLPKLKGQKKSAIYLRHQILAARVDGRSGNAKKAVARLGRLAKQHKKNWEVHFFKGHFSEALDDPNGAIESYEKAIRFLPETDPTPGVYALQRWAALSVSSDRGSYGNVKLLEKARNRYQAFLARAKANNVPEKLVQNVRKTVGVLDYFLKKRQ